MKNEKKKKLARKNLSTSCEKTTILEKHSWIYDVWQYLLGISIAIYLGYQYTCYARLIHENDMWFSNIKQVEREISFRTEAGLYFSYYKQMVLAPSISQGWYQLTHDNTTEHLRTINIVERFNIYQEVFLAVLYRIMPVSLQKSIEYVYFYIDFVFSLHGAYMMALFVSAWSLSGSFVAGVLANAFFVFNRSDMTRVSFTIALRESFSLPFIYMQIAFLTIYFKKVVIKPYLRLILLIMIFLTTFCFTITWQFAQFVILLEAFALYGVYVLEFVQPKQVKDIYILILINMVLVCLMQYGNDMLYSSLASSFCLAALLLISVQDNSFVIGGFMKKMFILLSRIVAVLSLMLLINWTVKKFASIDSDEHVFKFVSAKLGYGEALKTRDFDARLYLCEGSFQYLSMDTFERLTDGFVFPLYGTAAVALLLILAFSYLQRLRSVPSLLDDYPELVFNIILNVFFGAMAMTTLRMKFLWMPHMCVIAAGVFCHQDTWKSCLESIRIEKVLNFIIRHSIPVVILSMLVFKKLPGVQESLQELREFHDPDTVELMEWIKAATPKDASFTGSMQLLAGVKLSTDRPITNHPHYENKFLRQRTKDVYQIYARRKPKAVYDILRHHGTDYIILENSICYSQQPSGCRLTDILDVANGHDLKPPNKVERFCHAIKRGAEIKESLVITRVNTLPTDEECDCQ